MDTNTKLTLKFKRSVIDRAKRIAKMKGVSLSSMVENYFRVMTEKKVKTDSRTGRKVPKMIPLSPRVLSLVGILKGYKGDPKEDYTNYLIEKYK